MAGKDSGRRGGGAAGQRGSGAATKRRPLRRCALLLALLSLPSILAAQQRGVEIGLDGGLQYSLNAELLLIAVPFQRVRAAFPSENHLAFEPALSFTRISSGGQSLTALVLEVGALYDFAPDVESQPAARTTPIRALMYRLGRVDMNTSVGVLPIRWRRSPRRRAAPAE